VSVEVAPRTLPATSETTALTVRTTVCVVPTGATNGVGKVAVTVLPEVPTVNEGSVTPLTVTAAFTKACPAGRGSVMTAPCRVVPAATTVDIA
jgi:hypothetical protein